MPNKYYLRADRTAVKPGQLDEADTSNMAAYFGQDAVNDYLQSLPALTVDPAYLKTLSPGWFEGVERYEVWNWDKWYVVRQTTYDRWSPDSIRLTIIAPQEAENGQEGEVYSAFQSGVRDWLLACFGEEISNDIIERNHRFFEEAAELVQATGCTKSECHQLVDYVFDRPKGDPVQEVGGALVTLSALCSAAGIDMAKAGETELARVWTKVEKIRAKQAAKPKHSPLPATPQPVTGEAVTYKEMREAANAYAEDQCKNESFATTEYAAKDFIEGATWMRSQAASRPSDAVEWVSDTRMNIGRLEITCFNEDSEMSIRVGKSSWQSLTVDEAKELAHFIQSHIHHETSSNTTH